MKRLDNIKLHIGESEQTLIKIAQKNLKKPVKFFKILKKSLDARDKNNILWVYSIAFSEEPEEVRPSLEKLCSATQVAVIGSGPAGLMCGLRLVEHGIAPIIIERGECVEEREQTTLKFFKSRVLNPQSNVQFGEGGAGTFSDGKLNTQTHNGNNRDVLEYFARFGAPKEILYLNKPHIGSDNLKTVLKNIRKFIENNGGKYLFNTQFIGFNKFQSGKSNRPKLKSLILKNTKTGEESELEVGFTVLAVGHSSRDTFKMLDRSGIKMTPRDFAIGVRIEHLAAQIGLAQYGKNYKLLPAADYKLVSHAHERTVFTFCMCPGGVVIPAASEEGGVVVNGMSNYARNGLNSNSALMVQMKADDFGGELFSGMEFQREIERMAFEAGGRTYAAPVQLYKDFALDKISQGFGEVEPTYAAGTFFAPLNEILPSVAVSALKAAIPDMDKRLRGFANPSAILTGVETRFSSPVKIERGEDLQSVSLAGLYPCGEGAGYSGGITSSAADGIKIAEKIFENIKNHTIFI